jgi:hypothetical protein
LDLLEEHQSRPLFPIQHYRHSAALALILAARGNPEAAQLPARRALRAAAETESGARYHPDLSLVSNPPQDVQRRLWELAG